MKKQAPSSDWSERVNTTFQSPGRTQIISLAWVKQNLLPACYGGFLCTQMHVHVMREQSPRTHGRRFCSSCSSQGLHDALKQAQADLDKLRRELHEKREELQRLKQASGEKEAELLSEVKRLKERAAKDKAELEKAKEASGPTRASDARWRFRASRRDFSVRSRGGRRRRRWTTAPAWSCRKRTAASGRG